VLITGGGGFVGAFTAAYFAERGHQVVCYDLRPPPAEIVGPHGARIAYAAGDVLDGERLARVVEEHAVEGIVHAAAIIGQDDGAADPTRMFRINVEGTRTVLEAVRAAGLRMVYVSTATLYGQHPDLHPLTEDARPEPVGMYDTTKLLAETLAITYHKVYGLDVVAVRPGYVYGPRNSTGGYFLDRVRAGEAVEQPVGADLPIDATYVKDLAQGIVLAMTVRPIEHRIFNITGGVLRRRGEVAEIVRQLVPGARISLGPGIPPTAHLRGPSDLTRARTELGYAPRYTLEAGLADWLAHERSARTGIAGTPARDGGG
jgi:nucleoside-diphosphate-sugar epimerase